MSVRRSGPWIGSPAQQRCPCTGLGLGAACGWMWVLIILPLSPLLVKPAHRVSSYIYILVDSSRDHSDFELFMALNSNVVKCCLFATCTGSGGTDRCGVDCRSYMNVISLHKELCVVSGWQLEESRWWRWLLHNLNLNHTKFLWWCRDGFTTRYKQRR